MLKDSIQDAKAIRQKKWRCDTKWQTTTDKQKHHLDFALSCITLKT